MRARLQRGGRPGGEVAQVRSRGMPGEARFVEGDPARVLVERRPALEYAQTTRRADRDQLGLRAAQVAQEDVRGLVGTEPELRVSLAERDVTGVAAERHVAGVGVD